jgi:hypothetical protein
MLAITAFFRQAVTLAAKITVGLSLCLTVNFPKWIPWMPVLYLA